MKTETNFRTRGGAEVILKRLNGHIWFDSAGNKYSPASIMELDHLQNVMKYIVENIPHMMAHYAIAAFQDGSSNLYLARESLASEKAFFETVIKPSPLWRTLDSGQRSKIRWLHKEEHCKPKRRQSFSDIPKIYCPFEPGAATRVTINKPDVAEILEDCTVTLAPGEAADPLLVMTIYKFPIRAKVYITKA